MITRGNSTGHVLDLLRTIRRVVAPEIPLRTLRALMPRRLAFYGHLASQATDHPIASRYRYPTPQQLVDFIDRMWKCGYEFMSLPEYVSERSRASRQCLLTFDDGFVEVASVIHPLLHARRIPYAIFVHGPREELSNITFGPLTIEEPGRFLGSDDLVSLRREGVHIGFHGRRHEQIKPGLAVRADIADLCTPSAALASILSEPRAFAYPFRAPDDYSVTDCVIREQGFTWIFDTKGFGQVGTHIYRVSLDVARGVAGSLDPCTYSLKQLLLSAAHLRATLGSRSPRRRA